MVSILGIVHMAAGLLLVGLAVPLITRRVPMNRWYGVRIPKAYASDSNWYAINRVGGWWLLAAGVVLIATGALALLVAPLGEELSLLLSLAPAAVVLLCLLPVLLYAARLRD